MTRHKLIWLQIADQQYHDLTGLVRDLANHRIASLLENPTIDRDATYNERSDQWSVPLGDRGFLFYAVVRDPATVIILRLVSFF
jgi:hypothetical protein